MIKLTPNIATTTYQADTLADSIAAAYTAGQRVEVVAIRRSTNRTGTVHVVDLYAVIAFREGARTMSLCGLGGPVTYDLERRGFVVRGGGTNPVTSIMGHVRRAVETAGVSSCYIADAAWDRVVMVTEM